MQTVAKVFVGILMILFVGGVWILIQKVTRMLFVQGEGEPKEQLLGVGIGIVFCAAVMGLAMRVAWLGGIL
jgi:hypothetical protein